MTNTKGITVTSMQLLSRETTTSHSSSSDAHLSTGSITEAVLCGTGIVLLMSLAVIHVVQLVPTIEQAPLLGAAYVLLIVASVVVGVRLLKRGPSRAQLWWPVAALGVAVFVGDAFTRVLSTPLDNGSVGIWSCMLWLVSAFVEGTLVAVSAYAVSMRRSVL